MTLKRRAFVKAAGMTAAGAGIVSAPMINTANASSKKTLKMVTSWPKNFPGLGTAARRFGERLEAASGGRFKVKLYSSGELVHPLKCHDAVQEGTAELYHSADYYYKGKHPAYAFFTAVPFGFTAAEMDAWLLHGGGQALWDEVGKGFGVKALPCSNTGVQMGGWFKNPIESMDDLKGLKMRMPGMGGDVFNAIGGTAVTLGGSEIMPALQAGTIDATEWVGPWNDLAMGFYKVANNYYWPGYHEPGSTLSLGVNQEFWDSLSKADQELFTQCALAENNYGFAEFNANNASALNTLVNKHGVSLKEFPDDVYKAIGEASRDVLSDYAKKDEISAKVYESFMAFRKNVTSWMSLSDQGYMNKRDMVKF